MKRVGARISTARGSSHAESGVELSAPSPVPTGPQLPAANIDATVRTQRPAFGMFDLRRNDAAGCPAVGQRPLDRDGVLPATSLAWTSSRDGALGTGATFSRALSPGVHVVTLTVTDLDGNTGTDAVSLTITEP